MSMGRRRANRQGELWIPAERMAMSPGHPFYRRLNGLLSKHGFDEFVEGVCRPYYAEVMGRPSLPPGVYFRMLLVGYFEGLDSERGICWKAADSRSLGEFLGLGPGEGSPSHVCLGKTRNRLPVEVHQAVFDHVLSMLAKEGLLKGKTIGVDATTLEASAALRSIVRKDTGDGYRDYLRGLALASGIETPRSEELARFDRSRAGKKMSNDEWRHPHDPDARVGLTKSGSCDMVHKCEAASDLETGAVVAVRLAPADQGDTETPPDTLTAATDNLVKAAEALARAAEPAADSPVKPSAAKEVVADKGYHADKSLMKAWELGIRTYISEPRRGRRRWQGKEGGRELVYANRRRIKGERGRRLFRRRAEICERAFAHLFGSGGPGRVHLRTHAKIIKRLLLHVCGFNLSLVLRKWFKKGTPRGQADGIAAVFAFIPLISEVLGECWKRFRDYWPEISGKRHLGISRPRSNSQIQKGILLPGC